MNITDPSEIPVAMPLEVMVAIFESLLVHIPLPELGSNWKVSSSHNVAGKVSDGTSIILTASEVLLQPVELSVNVNVAVPTDIPVISPVLSMVATDGLLLIHVPELAVLR